jgi:hypothetical protein
MNTKRTGTVARLPSEAREEVSKMLYNGATYREIIAAMGAKGIRLQKNALTTWLRGGHQDWLSAEERLTNIERLREFAMRVVKSSEGTVVQQAAIKVAAAQIYELLMNYDPKVLKERLKEGDTSDYAKLINVMARLNDGGLKQEKYRDEVAEKKARSQAQIEETQRGGLTKEHLASIEKDLSLL